MEGNECEYNLYCPNGNTNSTCGKQIPTIYAEGPPVNNCRNYLWDYRLYLLGTCSVVGKAYMADTAAPCS
jgi:hypothetical protein